MANRKTSEYLKKTIIHLVLFQLFWFVSSCTNKPQSENYALITLDADSLIENTPDSPIKYSEIFSDFHIIPLETKEECLFSEIQEIKIIDSLIFIFDSFQSKSLYIFSIKGNFQSKVSKFGRGPGEYVFPSSFDIDCHNKRVLIYDQANKRINEYDFYGNHQRSVSIDNRFMTFALKNDHIVTYIPFPENPNQNDDDLIKVFDRNGNFIDSHLDYQTLLPGPKQFELRNGGNFFKTNNDIKFFANYLNTVYSLNGEKLISFLSLDSKKYTLTDYDLDNLNVDDPSKKLLNLTNTRKIMGISNYSENDHIAFFKFNLGMLPYSVFYNFKNHSIKCSWMYRDDLTFTNTNLCAIYQEYFIAYIRPTEIAKLKESVLNGKISLAKDEKEKIHDLTENSNPVLVLFNLKY